MQQEVSTHPEVSTEETSEQQEAVGRGFEGVDVHQARVLEVEQQQGTREKHEQSNEHVQQQQIAEEEKQEHQQEKGEGQEENTQGEQQQQQQVSSWWWQRWLPWNSASTSNGGISSSDFSSSSSACLEQLQAQSQLYHPPPAAAAFIRRPGQGVGKQRHHRPLSVKEAHGACMERVQNADLKLAITATAKQRAAADQGGPGGSTGGPVAEADEREGEQAQWYQQQQDEQYGLGEAGYGEVDEEMLEEMAREAAEAQRRARQRIAIRQQRLRPDAVYQLEEREAARRTAVANGGSAVRGDGGGRRGDLAVVRRSSQGRPAERGRAIAGALEYRQGYGKRVVEGGGGVLPGQPQQQMVSEQLRAPSARRSNGSQMRVSGLTVQANRQYNIGTEPLHGSPRGQMAAEGLGRRASDGSRGPGGGEERRRSGGAWNEMVQQQQQEAAGAGALPYAMAGWDDVDGQALYQVLPPRLRSTTDAAAAAIQQERVADYDGDLATMPDAAEKHLRLLYMAQWGFLIRDVIGAPLVHSPLEEDELADQVYSAWKLASNCLFAVVSSCSCLLLGTIGPAGIAGVLKPQLWCLLGIWVGWLGYLLVFHPYSSTLVGLEEVGCSFAHAPAVAIALVAEYVKGWTGEASGLGVAVLYGQVMWVVMWEAGRLLGLGWRLWIHSRDSSNSRSSRKVQPL